MRFYEFASSDDKLDLWRVIDKNVWQVLDQQTSVYGARQNNQVPKITATAPSKAEFKRRGTQIAAATARDKLDPNAQAAQRLQQTQRQQQQQKNGQKELLNQPSLKSPSSQPSYPTSQ